MSSLPVYLPATSTRPSEPAPALLTTEEVVRLCRLGLADLHQSMTHLRTATGIKPVRLGGKHLYRLDRVMEAIERLERDQ